MTAQPEPSDFSRNERENEYEAFIKVSGVIRIDIQASSQEDAQQKADAEVERLEKEGYVEIDDVDEIELVRVRKERPMFRVSREGKNMQVTHLEPGDTPREADELGF